MYWLNEPARGRLPDAPTVLGDSLPSQQRPHNFSVQGAAGKRRHRVTVMQTCFLDGVFRCDIHHR
jgi:hypothetical protein